MGSYLPFWKNFFQPEPDNKRKKNRRSWLTEALLIAFITVSGTALSSIIAAFISSSDKIPLLVTWWFPEPVPFSCEGITIKIPRNWHANGQGQKCQAVAYDADATITLKSFEGNEIKSPKLILITENPYERDITLKKFSEREKTQAEILIGQKNKKLKANPDVRFNKFKGHDAYELELVYDYDGGKFKRKDTGFLDKGKQYTIRYEASTEDFDKYEKEAKEIIDSLEFDPLQEAK